MEKIKSFFVIYHVVMDKFLLDQADPKTHHPYRWVEIKERVGEDGPEGQKVLAIGDEYIDAFEAYRHNPDEEAIGEAGVHVMNYLDRHYEWIDIMTVPLVMEGPDTGKPDYTHGFRL